MRAQVKILVVLIFLAACLGIIACGGYNPPTTVYFNDGFEGGPIGGNWLTVQVLPDQSPTGDVWDIVASGSSPTVTPHSGSAMAYFASNSYASGGEGLIYSNSGFTIADSDTSVTLTFYMYHDSEYSGALDQVQPQVSLDGGSTWNNVGAAANRYSATTGWVQHYVDLTDYAGYTVVLGFLGISQNGNNMYIDNVVVTGMCEGEDCP
jgi:hypothetical protein